MHFNNFFTTVAVAFSLIAATNAAPTNAAPNPATHHDRESPIPCCDPRWVSMVMRWLRQAVRLWRLIGGLGWSNGRSANRRMKAGVGTMCRVIKKHLHAPLCRLLSFWPTCQRLNQFSTNGCTALCNQSLSSAESVFPQWAAPWDLTNGWDLRLLNEWKRATAFQGRKYTVKASPSPDLWLLGLTHSTPTCNRLPSRFRAFGQQDPIRLVLCPSNEPCGTRVGGAGADSTLNIVVVTASLVPLIFIPDGLVELFAKLDPEDESAFSVCCSDWIGGSVEAYTPMQEGWVETGGAGGPGSGSFTWEAVTASSAPKATFSAFQAAGGEDSTTGNRPTTFSMLASRWSKTIILIARGPMSNVELVVPASGISPTVYHYVATSLKDSTQVIGGRHRGDCCGEAGGLVAVAAMLEAREQINQRSPAHQLPRARQMLKTMTIVVAGPTRPDETESMSQECSGVLRARSSNNTSTQPTPSILQGLSLLVLALSFLIPVAILEVGTIPEEVKNDDITGYKQYMESTSNVLHDSSDKVCNARSRTPDICGERRGIALSLCFSAKGGGGCPITRGAHVCPPGQLVEPSNPYREGLQLFWTTGWFCGVFMFWWVPPVKKKTTVDGGARAEGAGVGCLRHGRGGRYVEEQGKVFGHPRRLFIPIYLILPSTRESVTFVVPESDLARLNRHASPGMTCTIREVFGSGP
ncbi:hypothetical protein BKA70DRAFT_1234228 [Coprinopsis sp. MPI-PUGE-AT-0042]|nr:hypothetical protein BKA70DRAFT_1234228 [Coprinopsis sp. MPI-PUGE-AT-0042]